MSVDPEAREEIGTFLVRETDERFGTHIGRAFEGGNTYTFVEPGANDRPVPFGSAEFLGTVIWQQGPVE